MPPSPRRRIELTRTAAAIKRGGASVKAANVDPSVSLRYGTVSTLPAGTPPTVGVLVDGSSTEVQLGVLRSALPLSVNDVVLLAQLGTDLVVVDVVAAASYDPGYRNGTVVASTDANGRIAVVHATHAQNLAAPFPDHSNQPVVSTGDEIGSYTTEVSFSSITAAGFTFRVKDPPTGTVVASFGPLRFNYMVSGG